MEDITVFGEYVLVRQIMTKKRTLIHLPDNIGGDEDKFDYDFKIVQKGNKCSEEIVVGDTPIFSQYGKPIKIKVVEKNKDGMIALCIFHSGDIIGKDNSPKEEEKAEVIPENN
jgi:hypothetical protein